MTEVVKMEMATLITVARSFGPNYLIGDTNADDVIDAGDVVFLLNYLFLGGSAPYPMLRGDLDCSGEVDVGDLIFLINYLYLEGPEPPASC